jgi:hypothetical protein
MAVGAAMAMAGGGETREEGIAIAINELLEPQGGLETGVMLRWATNGAIRDQSYGCQ